jgi:hypothetical protein
MCMQIDLQIWNQTHALARKHKQRDYPYILFFFLLDDDVQLTEKSSALLLLLLVHLLGRLRTSVVV